MQLKSLLLSEIKAEDTGAFTGAASVYGVLDSHGDVVVPGAFTKSIAESRGKVKILSQHNTYDVIGLADLIDTPTALMVSGQLELGLQSARDAHVRLKGGLIDALSIGYETLEDTFDREKGIRYLKDIKLWEVSLVTFPSNEMCRITGVKSHADEIAALIKLADTLDAEHKAGRVLSAGNLQLLKECYEKIGALLTAAVPADTTEEDAAKDNARQLEELSAALKSIA